MSQKTDYASSGTYEILLHYDPTLKVSVDFTSTKDDATTEVVKADKDPATPNSKIVSKWYITVYPRKTDEYKTGTTYSIEVPNDAPLPYKGWDLFGDNDDLKVTKDNSIGTDWKIEAGPDSTDGQPTVFICIEGADGKKKYLAAAAQGAASSGAKIVSADNMKKADCQFLLNQIVPTGLCKIVTSNHAHTKCPKDLKLGCYHEIEGVREQNKSSWVQYAEQGYFEDKGSFTWNITKSADKYILTVPKNAKNVTGHKEHPDGWVLSSMVDQKEDFFNRPKQGDNTTKFKRDDYSFRVAVQNPGEPVPTFTNPDGEWINEWTIVQGANPGTFKIKHVVLDTTGKAKEEVDGNGNKVPVEWGLSAWGPKIHDVWHGRNAASSVAHIWYSKKWGPKWIHDWRIEPCLPHGLYRIKTTFHEPTLMPAGWYLSCFRKQDEDVFYDQDPNNPADVKSYDTKPSYVHVADPAWINKQFDPTRDPAKSKQWADSLPSDVWLIKPGSRTGFSTFEVPRWKDPKRHASGYAMSCNIENSETERPDYQETNNIFYQGQLANKKNSYRVVVGGDQVAPKKFTPGDWEFVPGRVPGTFQIATQVQGEPWGLCAWGPHVRDVWMTEDENFTKCHIWRSERWGWGYTMDWEFERVTDLGGKLPGPAPPTPPPPPPPPPPQTPPQTPRLQKRSTNDQEYIYTTKGDRPGASVHLIVWKPDVKDDEFIIHYHGANFDNGNYRPPSPSGVGVKFDPNTSTPALKKPVHFELVWTNAKRKKKTSSVQFWKPVPPTGYNALSHVVTTTKFTDIDPEKTPKVTKAADEIDEKFMCVHDEFCDKSNPIPTKHLWAPGGFTYAYKRDDVRVFSEHEISSSVHFIRGRPGIFFHKSGEANPVTYNLKNTSQ